VCCEQYDLSNDCDHTPGLLRCQLNLPVSRPLRAAPDAGARVAPQLGNEGDTQIETQDALRLTSDTLLRDLDALTELENEKRQMPQGDARLVELASRVQELAQRVLHQTQHQALLTQQFSTEAANGAQSGRATIAEGRRSVSDILAEWRAAERDAQSAEPESVSAMEARARADRLRDEYREAFDAAKGD
jgi:TolA-binding protein